MNRTPRLSKSGIEYLDYVWNFYSGCHNWHNGVCPVGENCWAKGITERFKHHYPNGFEPTFYPEAFLSPLRLKKPSIIGCAFMGDLFGDWIEPDEKIKVPLFDLPRGELSFAATLKQSIFGTISSCPQHTFLFKTKCPQNLVKWSPFPDNVWVGVTVTGYDGAKAWINLKYIEAKVKYISFEPLLNRCFSDWLKDAGINWVIIGAMTGKKRDIMEMAKRYPDLTPIPWAGKWTLQPKIEWVEALATASDKAGIPVFFKDNLWPLFDGSHYSVPLWAFDKDSRLRQELPVV